MGEMGGDDNDLAQQHGAAIGSMDGDDNDLLQEQDMAKGEVNPAGTESRLMSLLSMLPIATPCCWARSLSSTFHPSMVTSCCWSKL